MLREGVRVRSGGGRVRSTEAAKIFGLCFCRPDGFGSLDFVRIEIFLCSIDLYWFREPILLTKMDFLAREGSIFDDFVADNID